MEVSEMYMFIEIFMDISSVLLFNIVFIEFGVGYGNFIVIIYGLCQFLEGVFILYRTYFI